MDTVIRLPQSTILWMLGLCLVFPMLMVVMNEANLRLKRNGQPIAKTVRGLRNLVAPLLALYVLIRFVAGKGQESTTIRVVETAFWISVLIVGLRFINDVVFGAVRENTWQERVPKLFIDLLRVIVVCVGAAIIYSVVWDKPLEGALTALGVGSIVIGLALQEPLGNLVSGLMLMAERPIKPGDWIVVDDEREGKVIEVNWRSVHIETTTREVQIVPNSQLYKGSFWNLSRPTTRRTVELELGFSYDDPPNKVKDVLLEVMRGTPGIVEDNRPYVRTFAYADFSITYTVGFTVSRQEMVKPVRDEVLTRVWYAARRHGLTIPFPIATEIAIPQLEIERRAREAVDPRRLLDRHPLFDLPPGEAGDRAARRVAHRSYARGERVVAQGEPLPGLCLVIKGEARLTIADASGHAHEIARVGESEYFGEGSVLVGAPSPVSVDAVEDLDILVIDPESVRLMMEQAPTLARTIGAVQDMRLQAARGLLRSRHSNGQA